MAGTLRDEFQASPETVVAAIETTLRSASSLNGLVPLNLLTGRVIDEVIAAGYLREDEYGDVFLDTRGYEWLEQEGQREQADLDSLAEEANERSREWRNHWASLA